jgi:hypothetical protein
MDPKWGHSDDQANRLPRPRGDGPSDADSAQIQLGAITNRDGGGGLYFKDPNGHLLKIIAGGWNP